MEHTPLFFFCREGGGDIGENEARMLRLCFLYSMNWLGVTITMHRLEITNYEATL